MDPAAAAQQAKAQAQANFTATQQALQQAQGQAQQYACWLPAMVRHWRARRLKVAFALV